jgi:MFS family permease
MRGRVLGVWRSVSTGWGLVGPPLLGLLMEWAGARGALVIGGVLIAGAVGAGAFLHGRRAAAPDVTPRVPVPDATPRASAANVLPGPAPVPVRPASPAAVTLLMPTPHAGGHDRLPEPVRTA